MDRRKHHRRFLGPEPSLPFPDRSANGNGLFPAADSLDVPVEGPTPSRVLGLVQTLSRLVSFQVANLEESRAREGKRRALDPPLVRIGSNLRSHGKPRRSTGSGRSSGTDLKESHDRAKPFVPLATAAGTGLKGH